MRQQSIVAGDTLDFTTTLPDYSSDDGYSLVYYFTPRASGTPFSLTSATTADPHQFRITAGASSTALWTAGEWGWSSFAEVSGARYSVDSGQVTIKPNPATMLAGTDTRSQAEKAVADLKAAYASFSASQGHIAEYEIAGRRMKFGSAAEIVERMSFWQGELNRENAEKAVALGLADPRRIYLRAVRA